MTAPLATRTRNLSSMGRGTLVAAALIGLYALLNVWGTLTSGVVVAATTMWPQEVRLPTPSGDSVQAVWPYHPMVPVDAAPAGARWLVQGADALTPVFWAAGLASLGLVLLRAGNARSVFEPGVLRSVRWLVVALFGLALVPTGLRAIGNHWLVTSQGWGTTGATDAVAIWLPLFAGYLALAFEVVLRHGAKLQADLDEVI